MSKVVTFDFDQTLTKLVPLDMDGNWEMVDNLPIIEIAKKHYAAGDKLAIVTFRWPHQAEAIDDFMKAAKEKYGLEFQLGVHFTGSKPKTKVIDSLNSSAHYDDLILVHMELYRFRVDRGRPLYGGTTLYLVKHSPDLDSTEKMLLGRNIIKVIYCNETRLKDETQELGDQKEEQRADCP